MTTPTTRSPGETVDELDRMLTSFFQKELPDPLPALRLPAPSRRKGLSSRFALAASLAVFGGGALLLGGAFRTVTGAGELRLELDSARHESLGNIKTKMFLEQLPDRPTIIKIDIQELPAR